MRYVQLTQGFRAQIDDIDEAAVMSMGRWQIQKYKTHTRIIYYAKTSVMDRSVMLHRFIMMRADPSSDQNYFRKANGKLVDHKNGDGLDCQRSNLRWSNTSINALNSAKLWSKNTSGVKGVYFSKQRKRWVAEIKFEQVKYGCGIHETIESAAAARQKKEDELWAIYNKYGTTIGHTEQSRYTRETTLADLGLDGE